MYLSRIELDLTRRDTMRAMLAPSMLHGAIERAFTGERNRKLWRIDAFASHCYLLVLSENQPDFTELAAQFGTKELWETKSCDKLAESIVAGQVWQFRLLANPVRSDPATCGKRGKVHAHVTQEQQKAWLLARAPRLGFQLEADGFDVVDTRWLTFQKSNQNEVRIRTATFEGLLTIVDADAFRQALFGGVGREKAYGCGLLTVAKPKEQSSEES